MKDEKRVAVLEMWAGGDRAGVALLAMQRVIDLLPSTVTMETAGILI